MQRAAAIYMVPVKICAWRYTSPLVVRSCRPIGSANVQGRTNTNHTRARAEGSIFNPTTSAPTGAIVAQKVPDTVPT